jgi:hypothetical protein
VAEYINSSCVSVLLWRILSSISMGTASKEKNFPRGGKKPAVAVPKTGRFRVSLHFIPFHLFCIPSIPSVPSI